MSIKVSFLCILLSVLLNSSIGNLKLYSINGEEQNIEEGTQYMIMCYDTFCCHDCVIELISHCSKICSDNNDIQFVSLIKGADKMTMRNIESALKLYFVGKEPPTIYYDLNPDKRKRIFNRYKISSFPALIVINKSGKHKYYSCKSLFNGKEFQDGISVKTIGKINSFLGL